MSKTGSRLASTWLYSRWLVLGVIVAGIVGVVSMISRVICKESSRSTKVQIGGLATWIREDWQFMDDYYGPAKISWRLLVTNRMFAPPRGIPMDRTKPWDDPCNEQFRDYWGAYGLAARRDGPPAIWAIMGPGTFMDDATGRMSFQKGDVSIVLVETGRGKGSWTEPGDLSVTQLLAAPNSPMAAFVGTPSCGVAFHAAFSNGDTVRLKSSMPAGEFAKLANIDACRKMDLNQSIAPYRCDFDPRPVDPKIYWTPD